MLDSINRNLNLSRPLTARTPGRVLKGAARSVGCNTGRSVRPRSPASGPRKKGPLSRFETPPAVFYIGPDHTPHATDVLPWIVAAHQLAGDDRSPERLSAVARELAHLNPVPPNAEAWACLNLYPTAYQGELPVSDCIMIATRPEHFALDWHQLPLATLVAMIRAQQVIEELAHARGEFPLMFANAGGFESGLSLSDPHAQAQLCTVQPRLFRELEQNRSWFTDFLEHGRALEIPVPGVTQFGLYAHPASEFNCSLLAVARRPVDRLAAIDAREAALVLEAALHRLVPFLGGNPAYNIVVRGLGAGHLHMEILPRTTNIRGGAEIAAGSATIDYSPEAFWERLVA